MTPAPEGKEWFTVPQVAKVLGVHVQTIYDAVRDGRMEARGQGRERRIHAREILNYAVRTGKNGQEVIERIETIQDGIDWKTVFVSVITGLGLYALFKSLNDK